MALVSRSIDEILKLMADKYDGLVAPKRIFRNNNNKLWLAFRAIAAGYTLIQDAALALRNKFDPETCADEDLYSTAKLVGTKFKAGSGSLLQITATNNDSASAATLLAGVYNYTSVNGDIFSFTLTLDLVLAASASSQITARSAEVGAFPVSSVAGITIVRQDGATMPAAVSFDCADNSGLLGYGDETAFDFRQRILTDTDRQDAIKELELNIRNLPNILECNVVFNQSNSNATYDGIVVAPYQLLIIITGSPGVELAELVASSTIYATKMVDAAKVVYYVDSHYIGGKYPVYYTNHQQASFTLNISYRFDSSKILQINAEAAMNAALDSYKNSATHVDTLTEADVYTKLTNLGLTSVRITNIDILVGGSQVPFLDVPKTRTLNLTAATFVGTDQA